MKLSEAILLGSTLSQQCFGTYEVRIVIPGETTHVMRCALGSALAAAGQNDVDQAIRLWPYISDRVACPECSMTAALGSLVIHLNDDRRWTREKIAAFVADYENNFVPREQLEPVARESQINQNEENHEPVNQ